MDTFLRVGLELPPLPASGPSEPGQARGAGGRAWAAERGAFDHWRSAAVAASETGCFGAIWCTGGPGGVEATCDPCTLAAGLVADVTSAVLGVVSVVGPGRHPAVAARDVTTLDLVARGRAALLLVAPPGPDRSGVPAHGATRPEHATSSASGAAQQDAGMLAEAAAVCRAVFREEHPRFEGRWFHVAGAANRPPPLRPGGPPVLVAAPGAPTADGDAVTSLLRSSDALAVNGTVADVGRWRRAVGAETPLVWRGPLGGASGGVQGLADEVRALIGAGADGLIVQPAVPPSEWWAGDPVPAICTLAEALALITGETWR